MTLPKPIPEPTASDLARFVAKIRIGEACHEWIGYRDRRGYGHFRLGGRSVLAHRVAWRIANGPIPEGKQLDHLCRNPWCVNAAHLEPVTNQQNVSRGRVGQVNRERGRAVTHCPQGHEYTPENTTYGNVRGYVCRNCKTCHREREAARYRSRSGITLA